MKRILRKKPKHKKDCPFTDKKVTVINNERGCKVCEWHYHYCFYCGAKLK